jgi:formylglycine-generating enzyme required for sulfatase activity
MNTAADPKAQDRTVFLSFTSLDREAARAVAAGLKAADIDVWWDEGGVGWGDDWQGKIEQALSRCGAYVILLGQGGVRRWVKPELGVAFKRHVDDELPILPLLLDGVSPEAMPPFLSLKQARRLPADISAFDFGTLATELRAVSEPTVAPFLEGSPFPGLLPFDENLADFFLGRQSDTLGLLERLGRGVDGIQRRWLQVEGPSGVGKSSLVRAGLIPAVRAGWAEDGPATAKWAFILLRPGAQPLETLAAALEREIGKTEVPKTLFERLEALRRSRGDAADLRYLLKVAFPEGSRLLLVIDQFEELFTLTSGREVLARVDALLASALEDLDGPLFLVTTIRSDFLLHIGELPRLQGLLNARAGRYDLQPLSLSGLREIVRIPAQRAGLTWSERTLPERIVEDAIRERAPLPLVANLLRLLWDAAEKRGDRVLSAEDYQGLNGVAGALAKGGDRLLESLGPDGREPARRLLLALVKPGQESQDTKRPISLAMALQAAGGGPEAQRVLNRLSGLRADGGQGAQDPDPRLVVVSEGESGPSAEDVARVDLAHESLLRADAAGEPYWKTLYDWVKDAHDRLEDRDRLEQMAKDWAKGKGELVRGRQLRAFRRLRGGDAAPSDEAETYLRISGRRGVRLLAGSGAGLVLVAVLGTFAYWINREEMRPAMGLYVLAAKAGWIVKRPKMIAIRPGEGEFPAAFWMGSGDDDPDAWDAEKPRHRVTPKPFAIGRYEVTFEEYELFARSNHREPPSDEAWGTGDRPVINVAWNDARDYADWLSKATGQEPGKAYRLPSGAEWEYAARAGTEGRYWWCEKEQPNCDLPPDTANCSMCKSTKGLDGIGGRTLPVGSFPANRFGLYDTAGNVWEWGQDCADESYQDAPADGSPREGANGGDCGLRVLRGGSWDDTPEFLRSAYRGTNGAAFRDVNVGFRVAQDP